MLPNILPPANERMFTLCTLPTSPSNSNLIWFDCRGERSGIIYHLGHGEARDASWPFSWTPMLIPRTQDFVENFADESGRPAMKGRAEHKRCMALARWSYFFWLIIVQHASEIRGWVRGIPKKIRGASFCIIVSFFFFAWRQGGAGASDPRSVSKSFCLSFKCKPCSIIHEGEQE